MVSFRTKKNWNKPFSEKIARRVSRIPTTDLLIWADQTVYQLGKLLTAYERNRNEESLKEVLDGAEALHAVIHELDKRTSIRL